MFSQILQNRMLMWTETQRRISSKQTAADAEEYVTACLGGVFVSYWFSVRLLFVSLISPNEKIQENKQCECVYYDMKTGSQQTEKGIFNFRPELQKNTFPFVRQKNNCSILITAVWSQNTHWCRLQQQTHSYSRHSSVCVCVSYRLSRLLVPVRSGNSVRSAAPFRELKDGRTKELVYQV